MNFRFLKLTTAYPEFVGPFLRELPDHGQMSFAELQAKLDATGWGLSSNYSKHFARRGHEAAELYASIEPLQKAWAREHGLPDPGKDWKKAIALAQIKEFQPDVIFLHDLFFFDGPFRRRIRELVPNDTLIVGWRFAPTDDYSIFSDLDCVFTGNRFFADQFRSAGACSEILPLAFDADLLTCAPANGPRDLPITFAGSIGDNAYYHAERHRFLETMLGTTPLMLWGRTVQEKPLSLQRRWRWNLIYQLNQALDSAGIGRQLRARIPGIKRGANWKINPAAPSLKERFPDRVFPAVFGGSYVEILARSKIALNNHSEITGNSSGNMRMFEATGMGACLLTDHKDDLGGFFEADREIVTYRTAEEAAAKTRELLRDDQAREQIAQAGHARTLKDHTLEARALWLEDYLVRQLRKRRQGSLQPV